MKITRTYFLKQAFESAKVGDHLVVFSLGQPKSIDCMIFKKENQTFDNIYGLNILLKHALSDQWVIVPTEPKVLTVKEIIEIVYENALKREDHEYISADLKYSAELGVKNGRLEMWLEFKNHYDGPGILPFDALLKNLKPLNPE